MRVPSHFLINSDQHDVQPYVNFFNTFGYLHITNALTPRLARSARREYRRLYETTLGTHWRNLMRANKQLFIPNFYENSSLFFEEILIKTILPIAEKFSNGRPIYLGSDGSCFNGQSFEWHRDWFTRSRMLKFNIYMNRSFHLGGRHILIPGTQFTSDQYSQLVGCAGAWPFRPTKYGWLNEANFFPATPAPRDHYFQRKLRELTGVNYLPYVALKPQPTDIILFDQRTWHMVERPFPALPQMLATALFAVHPPAANVPNEPYLNTPAIVQPSHVPSEIEELAALYIGERAMINTSNYGHLMSQAPERLLHFQANKEIQSLKDFSSLKVRLSDSSLELDMKPILDYYSSQANIIRSENSDRTDPYTELMLGINYSNIGSFFKTDLRPKAPIFRENPF